VSEHPERGRGASRPFHLFDRPRLWVILATVVAFLPVLGNDFTNWDDPLNVTRNPLLNPLTARSLLRVWTQPYEQLYIPLTYTSYAFDGILWPGNPLGYHAVNLLLHLASALIVFRILRDLFGGRWPAVFGALLFAVHPVQTESVAWVTGRKDVLSGCLALGALALYLHGRRTGHRTPYIGAGAAFIGALLAKPSAVAAPLMALALDALIVTGSLRRAARGIAGAFVPAGACLALTLWSQRGAVAQVPALSLWQRMMVASDAIAFYVGRLAAPFHLGPVYGRTPDSVAAQGGGAATVVLAAAGLAGTVWAGRRMRAAALVFVIGFLPVLGLVPFTFQQISTVADRYLYLPLLGVALAGAAAGQALERSVTGRRWSIAAGLLIALLALATWYQVQVWRDSLALWRHGRRVCPDSHAVARNLAMAYSLSDLHRQALAEYRRAAEMRPDDAVNEYNMANTLMGLGRASEAMVHYRRSIALDPDDPDARYNYGRALQMLRRLDEAKRQYLEVLRLRPDDPNAHNNLGRIYLEQGRPRRAVAHLRRACELAPHLPEPFINFAEVLSTCRDETLRDGAEAVRLARRALDLMGRPDPYALGVLAAALAERGDIPAARDTIEVAIRIARRQHRSLLLKRLLAMERAFNAGRPYRREGGSRNAAPREAPCGRP